MPLAAALIATLLAAQNGPLDEERFVGPATERLHYRVRGADRSNPYLLILHGGPGFSSHMFYGWGRRLESRLNVVYLDQRGDGQSDRGTQPATNFSFLHQLADIESVRRSLGLRRWAVLGHSYGGFLGAMYVAAHPEHVSAYIHMDGLISQPWAQEDALDFVARYDATRDPKVADAARAARTLPAGPARLDKVYGFATALFGPMYFGDPAMARTMNAQILRDVAPYRVPFAALRPAEQPDAAIEKVERYATRDVFSSLSVIRVPTLVLHGDRDGILSLRNPREVGRRVRGARLKIYAGVGHFPFVERPEESAKDVLEFVADRP